MRAHLYSLSHSLSLSAQCSKPICLVPQEPAVVRMVFVPLWLPDNTQSPNFHCIHTSPPFPTLSFMLFSICSLLKTHKPHSDCNFSYSSLLAPDIQAVLTMSYLI